MGSDSPEQLPQNALFSPFVLEIPEEMPQDNYHDPPTYDDLLAEDIQQFGSPLPFVDAKGTQMQKPSLLKIAQKTAFKTKTKVKGKARVPRALKLSRHGTPYSGLPAGVVKNISTAFARSSGKKTAGLSKDCMIAILEASDKFFEQLGGDLAAASSHAGRKTIDDSDVLAVMRRCERSSSSRVRIHLLTLEVDKGRSRCEPQPSPWARNICRRKLWMRCECRFHEQADCAKHPIF